MVIEHKFESPVDGCKLLAELVDDCDKLKTEPQLSVDNLELLMSLIELDSGKLSAFKLERVTSP